MEIVRLHRLSCLDQAQLQRRVEVDSSPHYIILKGFNVLWHTSQGDTFINAHLLFRLHRKTDLSTEKSQLHIKTFSITGDHFEFSRTVQGDPKLPVILTLIKTWMPWILDLLVHQVPDMAEELERMWHRGSLSDLYVPNGPYRGFATSMIRHFVPHDKQYDEEDPWMLYFMSYAIVYNWWNGLSLKLNDVLQTEVILRSDKVLSHYYWPCDPCCPTCL